MAQEFFINSQKLEDKIRTLLPSQGGFGAGFDLSASTQIIPIIDLTDSSEDTTLRQDIQSASSFANVNAFSVNGNATLLSTTGYFKIIGTGYLTSRANFNDFIGFQINDGSTDKFIWKAGTYVTTGTNTFTNTSFEYEFVFKLTAGDTLKAAIALSSSGLSGSLVQIADINGVLT